jgi:CRP-like cAMP-binding protein
VTVDERVAVLSKSAFFAGLSAEELAPIARALTGRSFDKGAAIFRAGDPSDGLYLLVRGAVAIRDRATTLASVAPPDCFGELGALAEEPRSADAVCTSSCEVVRLSTADLHALMSKRPALQKQVLLGLVRKVKEVGRRARQ